jgi:protein-tyrosine kinase
VSASVGVLQASDVIGAARETTGEVAQQPLISREAKLWKPGEFAREQIRGLVRRVFFSGTKPARQVVFSAVEPHIDVVTICDQVARALAIETRGPVGLMGRERVSVDAALGVSFERPAFIKSSFNQLASNLWYVERSSAGEDDNQPGTVSHWLSCLAELRSEFEYVVIEGPVAGMSSEAVLLGQMTDGIILVLGAHRTRKATAQKIKQSLEGAQSRILGTVLSERQFPIPEGIYSRL